MKIINTGKLDEILKGAKEFKVSVKDLNARGISIYDVNVFYVNEKKIVHFRIISELKRPTEYVQNLIKRAIQNYKK